MLPRLIEVWAVAPFILFLRFADATSGEVNLSHLTGKGIFKAWDDYEFFKRVEIDPESGTVSWGDDIDLDLLVLYAGLKHQPVESVLP